MRALDIHPSAGVLISSIGQTSTTPSATDIGVSSLVPGLIAVADGDEGWHRRSPFWVLVPMYVAQNTRRSIVDAA